MIHFIHNTQRWTLTDALMLCRDAGEWQLRAESCAESVAAFLADGRDACLLVTSASQSVRVNNALVRGGVQPLHDGDCVRFAEGVVFTVRITHAARLGAFEPAAESVRCPVCRATLRAGDAVVWCGHCDAPHHQRCFEARTRRCGVYGCPAAHASQTDER
jgi:hypothetical protein